MANRYYRKYRQALATGQGVDLSTAVLKCVLVDTGTYTPDTTITGNEFLSDIPAGARVSTTAQLASVTVVDGVLDAADPALPDTGGATGEALVLYADTGTETTSRLIMILDTVTGLPITEDSTADSIQFSAQGILEV